VRTTGAPKSVTPGAESVASALPPVAAAAALLVETCATMAVQAARRGEFEAARYLLEQALTAIRTHVRG
jgi:type IV secretory pathway protease TraF